MKILVLPDIHGRTFWKGACEDIESYDKVLFLGDYFDPYEFEGISVTAAIGNFQEILDLKQQYSDKVMLLLGNHDLPYMFEEYYNLSYFHCRHAEEYHLTIGNLLRTNANLLTFSCVIDDILFTHAGVESQWFIDTFHCQANDAAEISAMLNTLADSAEGLKKLYSVSFHRGGFDKHGSCVWADVDEMKADASNTSNPLRDIRQVFGHTLQAEYDSNDEIQYGKALEFGNCKMVDTARAYALDSDSFTLQPA